MISLRASEQYPDRDHQLFFGSLLESSNNIGPHPSVLEYESWGDIFVTSSVIGELKKLNPRELLEFRDLKGAGERKAWLREVDARYFGRFRGTWSQLFYGLCQYLKTDLEAVVKDGGIIAADD